MASAFAHAALGVTLSNILLLSRRHWRCWLTAASHGALDALTTGGLGVAFFSPWDLERYFFSFRPIRVSPLGIKAFFSSRGLRVLASEFWWVGLPCAAALGLRFGFKKAIPTQYNRDAPTI